VLVAELGGAGQQLVLGRARRAAAAMMMLGRGLDAR